MPELSSGPAKPELADLFSTTSARKDSVGGLFAMNGWADPEPARWLNLQANPDVTVDLADGKRRVRDRAADGTERERLWARWADMGDDPERYAWRRSGETAVVVLEAASLSRSQSTAAPA